MGNEHRGYDNHTQGNTLQGYNRVGRLLFKPLRTSTEPKKHQFPLLCSLEKLSQGRRAPVLTTARMTEFRSQKFAARGVTRWGLGGREPPPKILRNKDFFKVYRSKTRRNACLSRLKSKIFCAFGAIDNHLRSFSYNSSYLHTYNPYFSRKVTRQLSEFCLVRYFCTWPGIDWLGLAIFVHENAIPSSGGCL